jgi:hypothetical protein
MMIRVLKSSVKVVRHIGGLWKRIGGRVFTVRPATSFQGANSGCARDAHALKTAKRKAPTRMGGRKVQVGRPFKDLIPVQLERP